MRISEFRGRNWEPTGFGRNRPFSFTGPSSRLTPVVLAGQVPPTGLCTSRLRAFSVWLGHFAHLKLPASVGERMALGALVTDRS